MEQYLNLFVDKNYPKFIDKYLSTKTLIRLKYVTQFCGCDYTKLYNPLFFYTRFYHSLVVAHMTWHFTHDKNTTIAALLHDVGTPCFAHSIDYVFGDYVNQETSEKKISEMVSHDEEILSYLKDDGVLLEELDNLSKYSILENKSPRLCTDRLDGVFHTCYIWLHTNSLEDIKNVYDNLIVLKNESGCLEIGFKDLEIAEKFGLMVCTYAKELQRNKDKYVMKYISEMVKLAFKRNLISLDDLYTKKESFICDIFKTNFSSWKKFNNATTLISCEYEPKDNFYVSLESKKRNTIPLVETDDGEKRLVNISSYAKEKYDAVKDYKDNKYAYIKEIKELE